MVCVVFLAITCSASTGGAGSGVAGGDQSVQPAGTHEDAAETAADEEPGAEEQQQEPEQQQAGGEAGPSAPLSPQEEAKAAAEAKKDEENKAIKVRVACCNSPRIDDP